MSSVSSHTLLPLAVAGALFAAAGAVQAAPECFWAVDAAGQHVRDSAGECVKSGLWTPAVATPAACAGPAAALKPATEMVTFGAAALFDTGRSDIKPQGRSELDALAGRLKAAMGYDKVVVTGHTDNRGGDAYNQKLSEARAGAVKTYLVGKGVDGSRIVTRGAGESRPVASNDTDAGRAKNRRVDIAIEGLRK